VRTWPALDLEHITDDVGAELARPDLIQAFLSDYDIAAIEESTSSSWRVFFQSAEARGRAAVALANQFTDLTVRPIDVPDEDWAARSQASLRKIQIGHIIVAPPWDVPDTGRPRSAPTSAGESTHVGAELARPVVVIIQPSMGFGTGHHATTRLCLAALQSLDLKGRSVIDVGTGSGVLAIGASLLGAGLVVAIDDDRDAIQAARENVALNEGATVDVSVTDLTSFESRTPNPESRFDVVLANLTSGLLIQAANQLRALARAGGHLVLSGFMAHEAADVLSAYSALAVRSRTDEDEWACVVLG